MLFASGTGQLAAKVEQRVELELSEFAGRAYMYSSSWK